MTRYLQIVLMMLAGCAQLPPLPGDAAAKKFEAVPDRAVIYVARHVLENNFVAPLLLDDEWIGPTYRGTYMRIVVPAGEHRIAGYAADSGIIRIKTESGKLYFVNQTTWGFRSFTGSRFELVEPDYGRAVVLGGTMTHEIIR